MSADAEDKRQREWVSKLLEHHTTVPQLTSSFIIHHFNVLFPTVPATFQREHFSYFGGDRPSGPAYGAVPGLVYRA